MPNRPTYGDLAFGSSGVPPNSTYRIPPANNRLQKNMYGEGYSEFMDYNTIDAFPNPGYGAAVGVGVLDRQTYQRGTRGSRLCGEDRDQETENSKVCSRTRDTRFIQVRAAKVANPTSYLGDQVWRPALGVGLFRSPARYPALLYIVQGAGS
jgi:hypothetical protein